VLTLCHGGRLAVAYPDQALRCPATPAGSL
jgi:hypothetical protein